MSSLKVKRNELVFIWGIVYLLFMNIDETIVYPYYLKFKTNIAWWSLIEQCIWQFHPFRIVPIPCFYYFTSALCVFYCILKVKMLLKFRIILHIWNMYFFDLLNKLYVTKNIQFYVIDQSSCYVHCILVIICTLFKFNLVNFRTYILCFPN